MNINYNNKNVKENLIRNYELLAEHRNLAKELTTTRADTLTPFRFAEKIQSFANDFGLTAHIFKGEDLRKNNMNLIYGVG